MRLGDLDALAEAMAEAANKYDGYDSCQGKTILGILEAQELCFDAPTIDAVPVCRCRDCKHRERTWCHINHIIVNDNHYCGYGYRKDLVEMKVKRYRKKPVEILAMEWTGENKVDIQRFVGRYLEENTIKHTLTIPTLEGDHIASCGDYIIQGVNGEFYPCKPDIFRKTYEQVEGGDGNEQNP